MKRDLKINFSVVEEIAREINKYKTALADMKQAAAKMLRLLEEDSAQSIDKLKEIYTGFNKELQKCRAELEDLETIFNGYTNEMQAIIRPVNKSAFMRVDRNDIYFNKQSIIQACEAVGFLPLEYNIGFGDFGIGLSEEQKAREEQNYRKIEEICREVIPRYSRRLNAHIDELNHLYNRKIIPFEDKDDEYKNKADRLYSKYSNLWERIRTTYLAYESAKQDFIKGVFMSIVDLIKGLVGLALGVICYDISAKVVAITAPFSATPKWADEMCNGANEAIGAILKDPMLLVEGIGQGVSDAFEEEGIFYCSGYAVGSVVGIKGIDKLGKLGKTALLGKSGATVEALTPIEELLANKAEQIFTKVESISKVGDQLILVTMEGIEISASEIELTSALIKGGMTEEVAKATVKYLEKVSIKGVGDAEAIALLKSIDESAMSEVDKAALKDIILKKVMAEAISKLRFKSEYADHLKSFIKFDRDATKGLTGCHNIDEFYKYFREVEGLNDSEFIASITKHPNPKFSELIQQIEYKVPIKEGKPPVIVPGKYKVFQKPKTVYDPKLVSDAEILKWGEEAMKDGIINNTIEGSKITGVASNGLKFEGWINRNVTDSIEITNFYPILD